MDHKMSRSPWVIHYDGSSCNGCDIEVLASLTPLFDAERFGVVNTGNPKHADIFLVTGSVNTQNVRDLRQPFGGVKASGTGREGGEYSFEVFAEMKNVCISMGDHPIPKWGV